MYRVDISEIKNHEELLVPATGGMFSFEMGEGTELDPITTTLILTSGVVGVPEINSKTLKKMKGRIELYQQVHGPLMVSHGEAKISITPEDIERRVGLKVNQAEKTKSQFLKALLSERTL